MLSLISPQTKQVGERRPKRCENKAQIWWQPPCSGSASFLIENDNKQQQQQNQVMPTESPVNAFIKKESRWYEAIYALHQVPRDLTFEFSKAEQWRQKKQNIEWPSQC